MCVLDRVMRQNNKEEWRGLCSSRLADSQAPSCTCNGEDLTFLLSTTNDAMTLRV